MYLQYHRKHDVKLAKKHPAFRNLFLNIPKPKASGFGSDVSQRPPSPGLDISPTTADRLRREVDLDSPTFITHQKVVNENNEVIYDSGDFDDLLTNFHRIKFDEQKPANAQVLDESEGQISAARTSLPPLPQRSELLKRRRSPKRHSKESKVRLQSPKKNNRSPRNTTKVRLTTPENNNRSPRNSTAKDCLKTPKNNNRSPRNSTAKVCLKTQKNNNRPPRNNTAKLRLKTPKKKNRSAFNSTGSAPKSTPARQQHPNKLSRGTQNQARRKWSPEEDKKLREAVEMHGEHNWTNVAAYVETRGNRMCAQRWNNHLRPEACEAKRGSWTKQEDNKLRRLVKKHGCDWRTIASDMGNRTDKQCRERWTKYLDPSLRLGPFTKAEDAFLLRLRTRHGDSFKPKDYVRAMRDGGYPRSAERIRRRLQTLLVKKN